MVELLTGHHPMLSARAAGPGDSRRLYKPPVARHGSDYSAIRVSGSIATSRGAA